MLDIYNTYVKVINHNGEFIRFLSIYQLREEDTAYMEGDFDEILYQKTLSGEYLPL